jgi:hypothetical protein
MIIFEQDLAAFKLNVVFWGSLGSNENWLNLKPNQQEEI